MKCLILLHSVTGNTRVVARYAASCIASAGHECTIHDIAAKPRAPALGTVDLLGVACPTMYFRPTFAMERFVARLPLAKKKTPVFLLGTAGGEPGAHFSILAEQLAHKDFLTMGACWTMFPESWPPHRALVKGAARGSAFAEKLCERYPALRAWAGIVWPEASMPVSKDRQRLQRFMEGMLRKAASFRPEDAVAGEDLHRPAPGFNLMGRMVTMGLAAEYTAVKLAPERCTRCGVCVKVCPVGCITRDGKDALPAFGPGCTGCWSCFQHCPEQAISGWKVGPGEGRYPGPGQALKDLFKPISR